MSHPSNGNRGGSTPPSGAPNDVRDGYTSILNSRAAQNQDTYSTNLYYNNIEVPYGPPVEKWQTADRMERYIGSMADVYVGKTIGDLTFDFMDPGSRNWILQASYAYHVGELGINPRSYNNSWANNWWNSIVARSTDTGIPAWSVANDILNKYGSVLDGDVTTSGGGGGYGGGGGGTSSTIRLTNRQDAMTLLNATFSAYLGREARSQEIDDFLKALNSNEMNNPATAEVVGDTVIQKGGYNPQAFAEEYARGQEGSAEFQAATSYLDSFLSVIDDDRGIVA